MNTKLNKLNALVELKQAEIEELLHEIGEEERKEYELVSQERLLEIIKAMPDYHGQRKICVLSESDFKYLPRPLKYYETYACINEDNDLIIGGYAHNDRFRKNDLYVYKDHRRF